MKVEELEHLEVYSTVLTDDFTRISVLSSVLEAQIRQAQRCVRFFKEHVDEIKSKKAPDKL